MTTRPARAVLAGLLVLAVLSGCSKDPYESYCDTVTDKRDDLSKILDAGGNDAFIKALPDLRDLRDRSPADIRADWQQIVSGIEDLQQALDDAGTDAASYDRAHPPAGVTTEQRDRIDDAAQRLNDLQTRTAFASVEQQARDVCRTPLLTI